jgi:hypothetical protein
MGQDIDHAAILTGMISGRNEEKNWQMPFIFGLK